MELNNKIVKKLIEVLEDLKKSIKDTEESFYIFDNIMIKLPNFDKPFDYENNFYLSCDNSRIGKILTHYELLKLSSNIPGCVIECGVFKGISLIRLATFLKLLKSNKKIIAFDAFGKHPTTKISSDHKRRKILLSEGKEGISSFIEKRKPDWYNE